jgi:hypothetical protein
MGTRAPAVRPIRERQVSIGHPAKWGKQVSKNNRRTFSFPLVRIKVAPGAGEVRDRSEVAIAAEEAGAGIGSEVPGAEEEEEDGCGGPEKELDGKG